MRFSNHLFYIAYCFPLLLLAVSHAHAQDASSNVAGVSIQVEQPFVRATPPGQKVAGAFMRLHNASSADIDLIQASSPVARVTEIHATRMQNGVMRMYHVDKITIPANGSTELKPGGLHVMLMGLQKQLKPGELITIKLQFSDQTSQTIEVPVIKVGE